MNKIKLVFAHDAVYSDSKDLAKRTISDKILKDRAYKLLEILNMMDLKEDQRVWCINFLTKKQD